MPPRPPHEVDPRPALTPMHSPAETEAIAVSDAEQRLQRVLDELLQLDNLDLRNLPASETDNVDIANRNRQLYVGSMLRLLHFIRRAPGSFSEEAVQAKIATSVMADFHRTHGLMQWGRSARDRAAVADVQAVMSDVQRLADRKVQVLARKQDGPQKPTGPAKAASST